MNIALARVTGFELAKALGLPTGRLVSFVVKVEVNEAIRVEAVYYAEAPVDGVLPTVLKGFKLVPNDPIPAATIGSETVHYVQPT